MAYLSNAANKSLKSLLPVLLPLIFVVLACNKFITPTDVNLFEGNNAADAAAKIKEKIGRENILVSRLEIRQNQMKIVVQDAEEPKNLLEYIFEKGSVIEPKRADNSSYRKYPDGEMPLTDLNAINFAAVPETIQQAIALANLEGAQVDLISMDHQSSEIINPQPKEENKAEKEELKAQIRKKSEECFNKPTFPAKCLEELFKLQEKERNLSPQMVETERVLVWRIFVKGKSGRKDFLADKQGKIIEKPSG